MTTVTQEHQQPEQSEQLPPVQPGGPAPVPLSDHRLHATSPAQPQHPEESDSGAQLTYISIICKM
jgi:hypothetical protein